MTDHFKQTTRLFLIALALCLGTSVLSVAQDITGSINGTVRDAAGGSVAGATVTITDPSKNNVVVRTVTTNDNGEFSAPNLPVSVYAITVEAPNFKKFVQTEVKLDVGQRRSVDFALEAGNISEVVTVEADPVAVDLTSPTAGTLISGDQVRELSVNNRNWVQLITLAPGVSNDLSDNVFVGNFNPEGSSNTTNISVNGARSTQNTFTVDGADVTDRGSNLTVQTYPSVDSIGEFKVLRSLYPAESGSSGGGQVNVVTRSGGKRFSGTLFEFVRNEKLNANDFFTNSNASAGLDSNGRAKRRPFRYNNYGWTLGGPVYFFNFGENGGKDGGLIKRYNQTFFFFSQEFRTDIRYPTLTSDVPTENFKNGIFPIPICIARDYLGESCGTAAAPNTQFILPANTPLPANFYSPAARAYIDQVYRNIPNPNSATAANPFRLIYPTFNKIDYRSEVLKIDHNFSKDFSAFYRYQQDRIPTTDANSIFATGSGIPFVSTSQSNSPGKTHTVQGTYAVSPSMIFQARYAYSYGAITSDNIGLLAKQNTSIPITLPFENTRGRVSTIAITGLNTLQTYGNYDNFSTKKNFSANLTYIVGSHTMKFGGGTSTYRKSENSISPNTNEGSFGSFSATLAPTVTTTVLSTLGVSANTAAIAQRFANFLTGDAGSFTQSEFDYTGDFRQRNIEAYAQDEWRFRSNVTLYMGVRYSYFGSPTDAFGRLTNFVPELFVRQNAAVVTGAGNRVNGNNEFGRPANFCNGVIANNPIRPGTVIPANCQITPSPLGDKVVDVSKLDFAPRVGLAWDPFKKGRTAIRTGYGIYHDQYPVGVFLSSIVPNPPFVRTASVTGATSLDTPVAGVAAPSDATGQLRGVQYKWNTPYMQHWSLDLQQQLTDKTIVTIGYYGSRGVHLPGYVDENLLQPGQARNSTCAQGNNSILTQATLVTCQREGYAFRNIAGITAAQGNQNVVGTTTFTDVLILDQIRPYRGYRAINIIESRFNSNYHSMQLSAQHRFTGASQVNIAYTWSKNLTDSQGVTVAPQNPYNIRADYGRAALDRRHIFTTNFVYELPFYKNQSGFVGKALGGWQASGIFSYNTGLPFTASTSNYDPAGIGFLGPSVSASRPNQIGDANTGGSGGQFDYFNINAFTSNPLLVAGVFTPVLNTPGNAGRGTINGPSTTRIDFTMMKNLRFNENMRLQLRAEFFNILNKTNFRTLTANVTSASYGDVTGIRDPRVIQLGIKFYF